MRAAFSTFRPIAKSFWRRRSGCRRTPSSSISRIPCRRRRRRMRAPACAPTRRRLSDNRVWVRVNGLDTGLAEADLDAVIGIAGLAGLFLPKVETREEVLRWDAHDRRARTGARRRRRLDSSSCSRSRARSACSTPMTWRPRPRASFRSPSAARRTAISTPISAAPGRSTGPRCCTRARTRCWPRARRGSTRPLDGVFADVRDAEGFERDTALSRRLGYRGRKLIHPVADRAVQPALPPKRGRARLLRPRAGGIRPGGGARQRPTTVDGKMIDLAMANAARRVLDAEAAWKKAG